jgi:phosphomannomutase
MISSTTFPLAQSPENPPRAYSVVDNFDYGFAENGLTAYKFGQELASQSFIKWIGEDEYKKLVKFLLHYIADMDIPIKR